MNENNIFKFSTNKSVLFRKTFLSIKNILTDVNITVCKKGLNIMALDTLTETLLVDLKMENNKFIYFETQEDLTFGINMPCFCNLIKSVGIGDILTLSVNKKNINKLNIKITNVKKGCSSLFKLNMIEVNNITIQAPDIKFKNSISVENSIINKICKNMSHINEYVNIKYLNKKLIMKCEGDYAEQTSIIGSQDDDEKYYEDNKGNNFKICNILLFSRCCDNNNNITIYIKNNYPLIMSYEIPGLGNLKLAIAPVV